MHAQRVRLASVAGIGAAAPWKRALCLHAGWVASVLLALSSTLCLLRPGEALRTGGVVPDEASRLAEEAEALLLGAARERREALSALYVRRHYANWASLLLNGRGVSPELARPLLVSS